MLVSELEIVHRRLRIVLTLPEATEQAFRAAVCESAFSTDGREATFSEGMSKRALFHFERIARASCVFGSAEQARADLGTWVHRYTGTRLRRRLLSLPRRSLHLAVNRELDLLAIGADKKCYGVRFVAFRSPGDQCAIARRLETSCPDVEGLIVYSIDEGVTRRYSLTCSARPAMSSPA